MRPCLILLLLLPCVVQAQLAFITNNGAITITGYTGSNSIVMIPGTTNGYQVTSIGTNAFQSSRLTSVTIPNTVITIGDWAFSFCLSLTNVTIYNGVTDIGSYAFLGCTSLATITIPGTVANLELESFADCPSLSSVTIGNGLASIGDSAFRDCFSLTNIIIPNSVTSIGGGAFSVCKSLTNAALGYGVTNIEGGPFLDCANLVAITVDSNNPAYSSVDGVLFNKSQTLLVEYPAGKAENYTIPNSVSFIAGSAFGGCSSLAKVLIPNNVTNIGGVAFANCLSLTNITIPQSVTFIGGGAFANCTNLSYVFFEGKTPTTLGPMPVFVGVNSNAIGYYVFGQTGWGAMFSGLPLALWNPQAQTGDRSFGMRTNQFGFDITGTTNIPIVLEACTNLAIASWTPLQTSTLTNGSIYFTDPAWTNYPARFYRIRSP